jgi:replicative DNA helicase
VIVPKELVKEAKEKIGDRAAILIRDFLELKGFDERNLRSCCPFHHEDTPSFIWNPKNHHYHCFGCSKNYSIVDLYMDNGHTYLEACEKLFEETQVKFKFGEKGVKTKRDYRYPSSEHNESKTHVEQYLSLRGIGKETLNLCDIQEDSKQNIIFNYYNTNDVLMTVKYRPARKLKDGDIKTWCQQNADTTPVLFNMNRIDTTQPLVITEGEIDCLSVIEAGYRNTVSVPFGAGNDHWIEENWEWLEQFEKIIIWSDNDDPGIKMRKNIIPRLGEWRCYTVESPEYIEKDGKQIKLKDINEVLYYCGKDKVLEYVNSAKEVPITNVVDLYNVQDFDIQNAGGIYSGFKTLDKWIYKFFFGCLSIITGINGSGKSVLINQMCICEPINQGYDVFVFSGELTKPQLKNWIELNFAGRANITTENTHVRKIESTTRKQIQDWYRGRIFIYDNDKDYSASALLAKMEEMARKQGTKVFIIDNLMMVDLECSQENIWQKQKEFVVKLVNFANKFNVLIHLVAHPRKLESIRRLSKMDVGGSGDITNLAHYVLAVHRVTPREAEGIPNGKGGYKVPPNDFSCMIDLFKNRITGTQDKDFGVHFDLPSYRFWSDTSELDKLYKWCKSIGSKPLPDPRDANKPDFMKGE